MECPKCKGFLYIDYDPIIEIYYKTCINCGLKDYDVSKSEYIKKRVETILIKESTFNKIKKSRNLNKEKI